MDNKSQLVEVSCNINVIIATDRFASIELAPFPIFYCELDGWSVLLPPQTESPQLA
jgi:hypothetical protein